MQNHEIEYKIKTADESALTSHLFGCADNFYPPLGSRVDIIEYAKKIFKNAITFEAWNNDQLVGVLAAYFQNESGGKVYITNVSVQQNYLRLGIATNLLQKCIQYANRHKAESLTLEVSRFNLLALGFYKKFNFVLKDAAADIITMQFILPQKSHE